MCPLRFGGKLHVPVGWCGWHSYSRWSGQMYENLDASSSTPSPATIAKRVKGVRGLVWTVLIVWCPAPYVFVCVCVVTRL